MDLLIMKIGNLFLRGKINLCFFVINDKICEVFFENRVDFCCYWMYCIFI